MKNGLDNLTQIKLQQQNAAIQDRLSQLETKLLYENENTQKQIDEYLKKQDDISKTIEYLDKLQVIDNEVENRTNQLKKEVKNRERNYKLVRKSNLESRIMDYKQGAARTLGTNTHDSYLDNIHYFQKQLSSLISSLES